MKRGSRFRIAAAIGTAFYLLLLAVLYQMQRPEAPKAPELSLRRVAPAPRDGGRGVKYVLEGEGFDVHTRVFLALDSANRGAVLAEVSSWGSLRDAAVAGGVLYVANHDRGVMTYDLSDPLHPRLLGTLRVPGNPLKMALSGETLFLCARSGGVHVIDISDPRALRLVSSVETGGLAVDLSLQGEKAFVANSTLGLQAIDISDPSAPRLIGTLKVPTVHGLAVRGGYAFLAAGKEGIFVANVGDPRQMRPVASIPAAEPVLAIAVEGDYAYAAALRAGVLTIDIRDPRRPVVIGAARGPFMPRDIRLDAGRAYAPNSAGGVQVFDLAPPSPPRHVGTIEVPGTTHGIAGDGARIYLATSRKGVKIVDVSTPHRPQAVDTLNTGGSITDLRNVGTALAMATSSREILLGDVGDATLRLVGAVETPSAVQRLAYGGGRVYAALADGGVAVFDVGDRQAPRHLHTVPTDGPAADLDIDEELLFAAVGDEVLLFERRAEGAPRPVGAFAFSASVRAIASKGDRLYAGDAQGGVHVLDIGTPAEPKRLGETALPWHMRRFSGMKQMSVAGGALYLADGQNGLVIVDVADPDRPQVTGSLDFPGYVNGVTVEGDYGYVSDFHNGLFQVDVRDPVRPQIVASLAVTNHTRSRALIVDGNILFATSDAGLRLLPLPIEACSVDLIDANRLEITLAPPELPGTYTVRVFNGRRSAELPGAITIDSF